jgi:hypothetical protein
MPLHEPAGRAVDREREHEQHETRGDQGGPVDRVGCRLAELVGDHCREGVALREQGVADLRGVADHERHRDRFSDRPPKPEDDRGK